MFYCFYSLPDKDAKGDHKPHSRKNGEGFFAKK
jgi:hypothetical protein